MRSSWAGLALGGIIVAFEALAGVTLISAPDVLDIPIHENHEGWVDLRTQTALQYGPSPEIPNNKDYTYLRKSVYKKLLSAQRHLPKGMRFCLYEGYRSLALQKMIFDRQYENVKTRHPDWAQKDVFLETTKLVSPVLNPDNSPNIPPHSTGAAVDVYLIDTDGKILDMGIHPKDWMDDKDGRLSLTASTHITPEALQHRRIMSQALLAAGFANYPTEYWHWSYGDRYWAYVTGQKTAIYGNTVSPH